MPQDERPEWQRPITYNQWSPDHGEDQPVEPRSAGHPANPEDAQPVQRGDAVFGLDDDELGEQYAGEGDEEGMEGLAEEQDAQDQDDLDDFDPVDMEDDGQVATEEEGDLDLS